MTFASELAGERVRLLTRVVAAFDCFVWLLATQLVWLLQRRDHGLVLLRSMLQSCSGAEGALCNDLGLHLMKFAHSKD